MLKRYTAVVTAIIFIITLLPLTFSKHAYAYSNSSYFNNLKIGLTSMSSSNVTITLNGYYSVNGQLYPPGSVLNLSTSGSDIVLNDTMQSQIDLIPNSNDGLLTITTGSVSNKYMGSLFIKIYNGKLLPVNIIDIENYLKGVVGYELSDSCPIESLKAQAVAARNFALSRIGWESAKGYDFDDTSRFQVYKGYNAGFKNVINAVDQTRGQILLHNEKLIEAMYSAWHGGISEDSENVWGNYSPYLRSVQDPFESDSWPNGSKVLSNAQIQSILVTNKYLSASDTFLQIDLNSITRFASGRVSNINIIYKDAAGIIRTKNVTKDYTRSFLSLPSNLYTVTYSSSDGTYTFSGKGSGHGLGMSQIGAKNRAAAGQTYDQILKFYYQNVYMQNLILKAALNNLTLSTNNLFVQNTISFSASAGAGNGYGYLYKYIVKNGTNTVFAGEYSNTPYFEFVPSDPGDYTIEAYVKDKYSISDYDDKKISSFTVYSLPVLNSLALNTTNVFAGQSITAVADAQKGSGTYLYKYEVVKDGTIIASRDFTGDREFTYTPAQSGSYTVTVYVRDAISALPYDIMQSQSFKAFEPLALASFNGSASKALTGDTASFTAEVNGGSDKGITYKYIVTKENAAVISQDFNTANTFNFTPSSAGNYQVTVLIKDSLSEKAFDVQSTLNLSVYNPQLAAINVSGYLYEGKVINFDAANTGASPSGFSYRYEVFRNGNLVAFNNFSTLSKFTFTPSVSGNYTVKVYGKDGLSTKAYDCLKQFNITVNSKPLYLSVLPLSYGMTNSNVASLQNALIKLGYPISSATGYFGTQTKSAVISFQISKGLKADGIVGSMTYNKLNDALIEKSGVKSLKF